VPERLRSTVLFSLIATALPATAKPSPEFAPVDTVLLSEDLFNYSYNSLAMTQAVIDAGATPWILGTRSRPKANAATRARQLGLPPELASKIKLDAVPHGNIWLRDFGPIGVTSPDGTMRYASFRYDSTVKDDDRFAAAVAKARGVPSVKLDLPIDGGDFLTDGTTCLTSQAGLPERSPLTTELGCAKVVIVRQPPHPHVDMWAKFVAPGVLLVNELDAATLKAAEVFYGAPHPDVLALKAALDAQATELAKYFRIVRLPMPLPYRGTFRTYSNAVLVNGTAIVPRYKRLGWDYDDYPDANEHPRYERAAGAVYAKFGFKSIFLDSDGLIFNGGALHCVMVPLPSLVQRTK
jgi:agmatine/peptidylarginine deiminase